MIEWLEVQSIARTQPSFPVVGDGHDGDEDRWVVRVDDDSRRLLNCGRTVVGSIDAACRKLTIEPLALSLERCGVVHVTFGSDTMLTRL